MQTENSPDYFLIFIIIFLLTTGLVMILSASSIRAYNIFGDSFHFFKRQILFAPAGIAAMILFMNIDYHIFQKYARIILLTTLVGLILVLIPGIGRVVGGSRRWLGIGEMGIQPSELAKLGIIIYLSHYLSDKFKRLHSFVRGILPPLIVLGLFFTLILMEPDLGTAITIGGTFMIMIFASGIKISHIIFLISGAIPLIMYFILSEPYRKERLLAFINPWADPLDSGYHIIQSLMALGSGGLFGVGLGNSRQKFLYLPEPGTDFIFSVLGEEFGLIGTSFILILYLLLGWRGLKISLAAPDLFGTFFAIGLTSMIVLQAFVNIGVVTSSIPITGITLPFISYGGSSLIIMLSGVGILLNISKQCELN